MACVYQVYVAGSLPTDHVIMVSCCHGHTVMPMRATKIQNGVQRVHNHDLIYYMSLWPQMQASHSLFALAMMMMLGVGRMRIFTARTFTTSAARRSEVLHIGQLLKLEEVRRNELLKLEEARRNELNQKHDQLQAKHDQIQAKHDQLQQELSATKFDAVSVTQRAHVEKLMREACR